MRKLQLVDSRVAPLDVLDSMEELGIFTQRTCDGAQSSDVLGVAPAGVVTTAVTV